MRPLHIFALVPILMLCMAETCGPTSSILPAYTANTVVTDDTIVGSYVTYEDGERSGTATVKREDTVDGPAYLLELKAKDGKPGRLLARLFRFDLQGARLVDLVLLPTSRVTGLSDAAPLPQHMFARVTNDDDGVHLSLLAGDWAEREKLPTVSVPVRYWSEKGASGVESARVLALTDQSALLEALSRALTADGAWNIRFDLLKPTAPAPLAFTLVDESGERSRDMSSQKVTFTVKGDTVTQTSEHRGRDAGLPGNEPQTRTWRLKDAAKVRALLDAARSAKRSTPARKVPPVDTRFVRLCLTIGKGKERCVERLPDDDSGADRQALRALAAELSALPLPAAP